MFGYVKTAEDELRVRELKRYKSYYCGLCKQIACYSQASRLLLSYDMVFLALLVEAEAPEELVQCKRKWLRRCKKRCGDRKLQYIAAVSVMLLYDKLQNDVQDGERGRRFLMRAVWPGVQKAAADFPEARETVAAAMQHLTCLERENCAAFETLTQCFAACFSQLIQLAPEQDEFASIRAEAAYHVAAWVYLFDMLLDVEEDRRMHTFNAILLQEDEAHGRMEVTHLLRSHLEQAETCLERLPYSSNLPILQNIVSLGLPLQMAATQASGRRGRTP